MYRNHGEPNVEDANTERNRVLLTALGCELAPWHQRVLALHRLSPVEGNAVGMEFRSNRGKLQDGALCTAKWYLAQCLSLRDAGCKEVAGLQLGVLAEDWHQQPFCNWLALPHHPPHTHTHTHAPAHQTPVVPTHRFHLWP